MLLRVSEVHRMAIEAANRGFAVLRMHRIAEVVGKVAFRTDSCRAGF